MSLLLIFFCFCAADADSDARAALALAKAARIAPAPEVIPAPSVACECGCAVGAPCRCDQCPHGSACPGWDYDSAYRLAVKDNRPLIVWVDQPARASPGCYVCRQATFPGVDGKACVVAKPDGAGGLSRIADLAGTPTNAQIAEALRHKPQKKSVTPAESSAPAARAIRRASGGC